MGILLFRADYHPQSDFRNTSDFSFARDECKMRCDREKVLELALAV